MRYRSTTTALVALSFAGLIACGGGDADGSGQMEAGGQASEEATGQMEETSGAADSARVTLAPRNDSGIEGTATIRHMADTMRVSVRLTGLTSGNSYPVHIHQGTCQEGGGVAAGLTSVEAQDGSGTSETRIPSSKLGMDASHFVQAHLPDGTPAACGDLPDSGGGSPGSGMDTASAGG